MKTHNWIVTVALTAICFVSFGFVAHPVAGPFDSVQYETNRGWIAIGGQYGTGTVVSRTNLRLQVFKKDGIGTVVIMDTLKIAANDPITPTLGLLTSIDASVFKASCDNFFVVTLLDVTKHVQWKVDLKSCTAVDLRYSSTTKKVSVMVDLNCPGVTRPSI